MAVIEPTRLPFGGESILVSRMRKLAPEMVVVSLLPPRIRFSVSPYAFVRAIPGKQYDWRFLKKLAVMVVCDKEHATVGIFEQLCREAFPVKAWFHSERRGYHVMNLPTIESIEREDSRTWDWRLNFDVLHEAECAEWREYFERAIGEFAHV